MTKILRELHVPHQTEPKGRYLNNEDRPDITAFNINSGVNFDLDIAMAHPFSKDIVKRSSEETGHAAEKRAEKDSQVPKSDYANRRSSIVCAFGL